MQRMRADVFDKYRMPLPSVLVKRLCKVLGNSLRRVFEMDVNGAEIGFVCRRSTDKAYGKMRHRASGGP